MRVATALILVIGGARIITAAPLLSSGVEKRGATSLEKGLLGSAVAKEREASHGIASRATIGMRGAPDVNKELDDPLSIGS